MSSAEDKAFVKQLLHAARRDVSPEEAERGVRIYDGVIRATGVDSARDQAVTAVAGDASRAWLSGVGGIGLSLLVGGGVLFLSNHTSPTLEVNSSWDAGKAVESARPPLAPPSADVRDERSATTDTSDLASAAPPIPVPETSVWELPSVGKSAEQEPAHDSNANVSGKHLLTREQPAIRRSTTADQLGIELSALEAARNALRRGNAARALTLLDDFDRRFPGPYVRDEAIVLRLEVLFALGREDDARRLGHDFVVRHSDSIYRARVVQLVGEDTP